MHEAHSFEAPLNAHHYVMNTGYNSLSVFFLFFVEMVDDSGLEGGVASQMHAALAGDYLLPRLIRVIKKTKYMFLNTSFLF